MNINEKIDFTGNLINFIGENNTHPDSEDIRSITIDSIAQAFQNFWISLKLSKELQSIDFVQEKISDQFKESDLEDIEFNLDGFIKDALFTRLFISLESHLKTIARHFETKPFDIYDDSIKNTFKNLLEKIVFFTDISDYEKNVVFYFFYLRNTIHNFGIQNRKTQILEIEDPTSVVSQLKFELKLIKGKTNVISSLELLLLFEQVIKVIIKLNSLIPTNEIIKHPLADFDY
ncbi:hypothetical protein QWZ06_19565 [Chryseobacterium tructae]|uniref:PRD domain-containing protein n=1 Tax=Chryseobacterium tructae TaxID=1037380 RepID=A0ABV7Y044_9FLAO|nr:hypothetical protein [Chryseobacterium tructae]MDN3694322.1 hypothetical protein [Chryseobacterium tructae]